MTVVVEAFDYSPSFAEELRSAPVDCQRAARDALNLLMQNPKARTLRLHPLKGYGKPTIYKIDVFANHSWQITFELVGTTAILRRLATHRDIDRRPR